MADVDPKRVRAIKIKTGVVKRLGKEKTSYEKEMEKEMAKVEDMKAKNADSHDIKKQEEVVGESEMMIPDTTRRLVTAWDELNKLMESEGDLKETEEYKAAMDILEVTKAQANR